MLEALVKLPMLDILVMFSMLEALWRLPMLEMLPMLEIMLRVQMLDTLMRLPMLAKLVFFPMLEAVERLSMLEIMVRHMYDYEVQEEMSLERASNFCSVFDGVGHQDHNKCDTLMRLPMLEIMVRLPMLARALDLVQ